MASRLATKPVLIEHGGNAVHLRPSLRAALIVHASHGLTRLHRDLTAGNLATVLAVADATADDPIAARAVILDLIAARGMISLLSLTTPLCFLIMDCFGIDPNAEHPAERIIKPDGDIDMGKALADLFEIGTGWLGWTPSDAWAATPAEIMAARSGLIDKLRAIHGGNADDGDQASHDPREEIAPEKVRAGLAELRGMAG